MGASNAGGVGKNHDLSQYLAPSHAANVSTTEPWQVDDTSRW